MLTDTEIRKTKPQAKPFKLADGRGLYLLVNPGGGKLWRFDYRFDGKRKTLSMGAYRWYFSGRGNWPKRNGKNSTLMRVSGASPASA
jgi:hypothetical protein